MNGHPQAKIGKGQYTYRGFIIEKESSRSWVLERGGADVECLILQVGEPQFVDLGGHPYYSTEFGTLSDAKKQVDKFWQQVAEELSRCLGYVEVEEPDL